MLKGRKIRSKIGIRRIFLAHKNSSKPLHPWCGSWVLNNILAPHRHTNEGDKMKNLYNIEMNGNWHLYQAFPLHGWEIIGTVQRCGDIGALVKNLRTGLYAQANAGAIRSLDQAKVRNAMGAHP